MEMTVDITRATSSVAIKSFPVQQAEQAKCEDNDDCNGLHHVEHQDQQQHVQQGIDVGRDEREEGEIVDEFEDIISSDEELSMRKRIEELEARNAELEKIANISGIYDYDLNYVNDRYQKSDTVAYNHKDDYTADDYHPPSLYTSSTIKRLKTKPSLPKLYPSKNGASNTTAVAPTSITVTVDRDLKHRHHHHHHHHHHSYNSHKTHEIYDYIDERDYISPPPESLLIKHRKRKRKYQKESRSRNKKSTRNEKRRKKSRMISPSPLLSSSGDENEACILNRDELRYALKRDITTRIGTAQNNLQKNLKIKLEKNENSKNEFDKVIRTIDLVADDSDVDVVDGGCQENERIIVENSEDDDDDSASLEEQELRLIALKSAVVKKHLARKKRRESDDKRPYSPSDNFIEVYDMRNNDSSRDMYSLSSPFGCTIDTPPPRLDLEHESYNNSMDISPITSPELSVNNDDASADCVLKPIDMEIANSDSSNSPSPIFEQQQRNYNNWMPIDQIPLPDNDFRGQQQHLICSPKAIKVVPPNESYVPLIVPPPSVIHRTPSISPSFQQQKLQKTIEVDDNEKLVIRRSSSLDDEIGGRGQARGRGEHDDDESTDEEESALRALLLATMNSAQKQLPQRQQEIVVNEKETIEREEEEEECIQQLDRVTHKPPLSISCDDENNVPENKNEEDSSIDIETLKDFLLITMNSGKKRQQQQPSKKPVNKTEIVLKEAVKRLKNKEAALTPPPRLTTDQNELIGSSSVMQIRDTSHSNDLLRITENSNSFSPTIMQQQQHQHLVEVSENIIEDSTNDDFNYTKAEKDENHYEFNDDDIENMINIFEKVQFDNIKFLHENITKHQQLDEQKLEEIVAKNHLRIQPVPEKETNLNDVVEDETLEKRTAADVDIRIPPSPTFSLSIKAADNAEDIFQEKVHEPQIVVCEPSNSLSENVEMEQKKISNKNRDTTIKHAKKQQSGRPQEVPLKKSEIISAGVKAKKGSVSPASLSSSSVVKVLKNVNNSGKITKTRTKVINKISAQNTQLLKNRKILKTIVNSKDDISCIAKSASLSTLSSSVTALKIANKSTTRLITKPDIPKVEKIIIRLGESSSDDEINNENDELENYNNCSLYCGDNDDNASPMSLQMDDSPVYSPVPLAAEPVEKTVVNDVFQAKLDEFLKSARTKIDKIKKECGTMTAKTQTNVVSTVEPVKTVAELPAKTIATKTPTAVRHLPASSQLEYRRLINRMKILEKQKQARKTQTNSTRDNLKVTIKNDQVTSEKPEETSSKPIVPSTIQRIIITDTTHPVLSAGNLNEINSKEKLIKKVLIKNASNLPHIENNDLSVNDESKKETSVDKDDVGTNKENDPVESANEKQEEIKLTVDDTMNSDEQNAPQMKVDMEKSSVKPQSAEDVTTDAGNETTADRLQSNLEQLKKTELLKKYEKHLKDESLNLVKHITKTINLVLQAKEEKLHRLQLQQKYEQLQMQLKLIENDLDQQNKKLSRKIYPEISKSHKIIVDLKTKCNNLGKITTNLGKTLHGNDYGLELKEKSLILDKSKQLSKEIKSLKGLNHADLKQSENFEWKIVENLKVQEKEKHKGNLMCKSNETNLNSSHENVKENQAKASSEVYVIEEEIIGKNVTTPVSDCENQAKAVESTVSKEVFTATDQEITELSHDKVNEIEKMIEDDTPVIHESENCILETEGISKNPRDVEIETNLPENNKLNAENFPAEETNRKEVESNLEDTTETRAEVCENVETSITGSKSNNEIVVEMETVKQDEQVIQGNTTPTAEIMGTDKGEREQGTTLESMKTYVSPLEHIQHDRTIGDPNGIICPYQLMGQCDDKECKFVHLPSQ